MGWLIGVFISLSAACALTPVVAAMPGGQAQKRLSPRFAAAQKADPKKLAEELVNKAAW
jgi:hypothetical protein